MRAHDATTMQPSVLVDSYLNFLTGKVAFVGVVGNNDMDPTVFTTVVVATGTPMLPFTGLFTGSFFPHHVRVVKAL